MVFLSVLTHQTQIFTLLSTVIVLCTHQQLITCSCSTLPHSINIVCTHTVEGCAVVVCTDCSLQLNWISVVWGWMTKPNLKESSESFKLISWKQNGNINMSAISGLFFYSSNKNQLVRDCTNLHTVWHRTNSDLTVTTHLG